MKTTDEPWVLYFPDLGMVRLKGKDFKLERDLRKVGMWMDKEAAERALATLNPQDVERKLMLPHARAYPMSLAMEHQRQHDARQALRNVGQVEVTDFDRRDAFAKVADKVEGDEE